MSDEAGPQESSIRVNPYLQLPIYLINVLLLLNLGHWLIKYAPFMGVLFAFLCWQIRIRNKWLQSTLFLIQGTQGLCLGLVFLLYLPIASSQSFEMTHSRRQIVVDGHTVYEHRLQFVTAPKYYEAVVLKEDLVGLPNPCKVEIQVSRSILGPTISKVQRIGSQALKRRKDSDKGFFVVREGFGWRNRIPSDKSPYQN